jgi:hypothetical protein
MAMAKSFVSPKDLPDYGIEENIDTIRRWIKNDKFPKPVKFGHHVRWPVEEINQWVAARLAEREQ